MGDRYTIYINKDGRTRVYDNITKKVTSYPRFLMAAELGRPLTADEQVHHKDGNPLNNSIDNLEVLSHAEHARLHATKYVDVYTTCEYCGKEFLWTSIQQQRYYSNKRRRFGMSGPYCSKHCAALGSRNEHHDGDIMSECE